MILRIEEENFLQQNDKTFFIYVLGGRRSLPLLLHWGRVQPENYCGLRKYKYAQVKNIYSRKITNIIR